jgi:hypothetical protein
MHTLPQESGQAIASSVARLWPHREHESSALKIFMCGIGLHRWLQLDTARLVPAHVIHFCFWCSKIRVDRVEYEP